MKKFILSLMTVGMIFASCKEQSKEIITDKYDDMVVMDSSNENMMINNQFRNQIEGTYEGTLPCASCEGIETSITFNEDGSYNKKEEYLGEIEDNNFSETGHYEWNKNGEYITLYPSDDIAILMNYRIESDRIIQLDEEGHLIEDELADAYVLNKK